MTFSQKLVLWLHVGFVIFTVGPVTLAIMSTPRYIRQRDVRIVRYLSRITFMFTLATLGVLIAGMALASMISVDGKWWVIVSATLYIVALLLLGLVVRDQRKAIKALDEAGATVKGAASQAATAGEADLPPSGESAPVVESPVVESPVVAGTVATVERGRIAMMGGVVSLIWLVILVLMVWH